MAHASIGLKKRLPCLNSDRLVRTVEGRFRRTPWRPAFAHTSVRSAPPALTACLRGLPELRRRICAQAHQTVEGLERRQFSREGSGEYPGQAQAGRSGKPMRCSRRPSRAYRLTTDRAAKMASQNNHCMHLRIGMLLFPQVTQLDLTGPHEVFSRMMSKYSCSGRLSILRPGNRTWPSHPPCTGRVPAARCRNRPSRARAS